MKALTMKVLYDSVDTDELIMQLRRWFRSNDIGMSSLDFSIETNDNKYPCCFAESKHTDSIGDIVSCSFGNCRCIHNGGIDVGCPWFNERMKPEKKAKNKVNDHGLSFNVPHAVNSWCRYEYQIEGLKKRQKSCLKDINLEIDSAKKFGYSKEEIVNQIGSIKIPAWFLIDNI